MKRKAYIQIELTSGEYLKPFITCPFVNSRINSVWDKCIANLKSFRSNVRSIHMGYADENGGQIMAFAWVNQTKLS